MNEEYKSKEWITLKDQVIANKKCIMCGAPAETAHHLTYVFGLICDKKYLIPVCWPCHNEVHGYKPRKEKEPLKGIYFHTVVNGVLIWQGFVRSHISDDRVALQLFSWLDGRPTNIELVDISTIKWNEESKTGFILYPDRDEMTHAYEYGRASQFDPCQK
jgi:hypothetical protein